MKAYLSHCIRGAKGADATHEDMEQNCKAAIEYGNKLRNAIPDLDLYIPAEHEAFVQRAYDKGFMTEDQILSVDCDILRDMDCVIAYNPECISHGMQVEVDFATHNNIPVLYSHYAQLPSDTYNVIKLCRHEIEFVTLADGICTLRLLQKHFSISKHIVRKFQVGDILTNTNFKDGMHVVRIDGIYGNKLTLTVIVDNTDIRTRKPGYEFICPINGPWKVLVKA